MNQHNYINVVVCNILSGKRYSHCRLCLSEIGEKYTRLEDAVSVDPKSGVFTPLNEVLIKLLGQEFGDEIQGIDALCIGCVSSVLTALRFIESCKASQETLKAAILSISDAFENNINIENSDKLFINIEEAGTELLVLNKPAKRRKLSQKKSIECLECFIYFDNFNDLKVHNLAYHSTITCDKCYKTFISDDELSNHQDLEHKHTCPDCPHFQGNAEGIKQHHDQYHAIHICQECGKYCKGLEKLNIHEEKHKRKNSCPKCGKTYSTKDFYERHIKLCLNNLIDPHPTRSAMFKPYSCEKCDKAYSTPGGLRVHNRFAHGNAKPHECPECGKKFTAPSYLKTHMIKHTGEKNFKCSLCNNRFVSKEALLYHTRRHTGERPYSCKLCDERFVNASARAEHIKFKHVGPQLICEICSRKFVTRHFLKLHLSRHSDPSSKIYSERNIVPPNLPVQENVRSINIEI